MENEIALKKLDILKGLLLVYAQMQHDWIIKCGWSYSKTIQEKIDETLDRIEAIEKSTDKIEVIK